jgi:hypothetical protein
MAARKARTPKAKPTTGADPDGLRIRNKEIKRFRVGDVRDNPKNHRTHTEAQGKALGGTLDDIGWYGYPPIYLDSKGRPTLIDGELRRHHLVATYGEDAEIEFNLTDMNEKEAAKALATHDALGAMAETDYEKYSRLIKEIEAAGTSFVDDLHWPAELIEPLLAADWSPPDIEPMDTESDDQAKGEEKVLTCPKCGHSFTLEANT